MNIYLILLINSLIIGSIIISFKYISNQEDIKTLSLLRLCSVIIAGLLVLIYHFLYDNEQIQKLQNIDNKIIKVLTFTACMEIASIYVFFTLISKKDASWTTPLLEAGIIITTLLLSYFLLEEKITKKRLFGIVIILCGICIFYYN